MKRDQGFVLITTLLIAVVIGVLLFGTAITGMLDRMVTSNQKNANAAYYLANAGLQQYKLLVFKNLVDFDSGSGQGWCNTPIERGIVDPRTGEVILAPGATTNAEAVGPGSYQVSLDIVNEYVVLTSVGTAGDAQATLQLVAHSGAGPSTAWDNALFAAGEVAGAQAINGHVGIHGSLHIVNGQAEIYDLGGNAGIYNDYPDDGHVLGHLADMLKVPAGTNVRDIDLCTRVKIKRGDLKLTGNAKLGTSGKPIKSVHLNHPTNHLYAGGRRLDSSTGVANVNVTYPGDGSLYSPYGPFDIEFPQLDPNFPNDVPGFNAYTGAGAAPGCAWLFDGSKATLPPKNPRHNPNTDSPRCGDSDNYIEWKAGGYFVIHGNVNLGPATLHIPKNEEVAYEGFGALRLGTSRDDIGTKADIQGGLSPRSGAKFPDNALAIVAAGDMYFDVTKSIKRPLAFLAYATGDVTAKSQVFVLGSIVAGKFDLGSNVPHLMHHPSVGRAAERLCLPGSFCAEGEGEPNPGLLSNISIERRDNARHP